MTTLGWLLVAWVTAFVVSAAPAFMPPMWAVLAAFKLGTGVPLLPLTLGAAIWGALGRLALAGIAQRTRSLLPEADRRNAEALGDWFRRRRGWKWPLVAFYCAGPFPSNALFIAAGAGRLRPQPLALVFALSRAVSDTFWVWTGVSVAQSVRGLVTGALTDWRMIAGQVLGAFAVVLVFRLPWGRWLGWRE